MKSAAARPPSSRCRGGPPGPEGQARRSGVPDVIDPPEPLAGAGPAPRGCGPPPPAGPRRLVRAGGFGDAPVVPAVRIAEPSTGGVSMHNGTGPCLCVKPVATTPLRGHPRPAVVGRPGGLLRAGCCLARRETGPAGPCGGSSAGFSRVQPGSVAPDAAKPGQRGSGRVRSPTSWRTRPRTTAVTWDDRRQTCQPGLTHKGPGAAVGRVQLDRMHTMTTCSNRLQKPMSVALAGPRPSTT